MSEFKKQDELDGIAIIGMAGRFPGADNIEALWKNLCDGIESIRFFKDEELDTSVPSSLISDKNYIKARGIIDNIESFDAGFFNCLPREAQIMDPQNRIFLEVAWESLEKAGYIPGTPERKIGIFAGKGYNSYYANKIFGRDDVNETFGSFQAQLLNEKDFFSTQTSYKLNLTGPSINVNTACSTSLVAVCLACDSLLGYQCDIALAGGVSIFTPQNTGYLYQEGNIASSDGHCRPFDKDASGTLSGNGVGIVVLKRLSEAIEDGDFIYAVIKGWGLNNDGSNKMSFTAPGIVGQAEAIMMAQGNAGISAETISYIEAHGTATPLGDPVEIEALSQAFHAQTNKKQFCAIGSIKGNVGHLDSAAGVAGLIKTALALYNKKLPPSINFVEPNSAIDFKNSPFFVNTELLEWGSEGMPRRAGVSSFGFGGTNAHVVLEEAPFPEPSGSSRKWHLLPFSARSEAALNTSTANMAAHLEKNQGLNLADVAFTLQVGRKEFAHRGTIVCSELNDAITPLRSTEPRLLISEICEADHRDVVFMFSGQGSQYANMGLDLYKDESVFREQIDYCSETLRQEMSVDLRQLLYPAQDQIEDAEKKLEQTSFTQPALFVTEFALARLWMSWGIKPQALVGHSIGEYTAACLAGVFSLEDALRIVAVRGRLMQDMPHGSMLAVFLPEDQLSPFMNDDLCVSVINSPSICVVSGKDSSIDNLENDLSKRKIMCRRLHTSHAFHSKMMDPVLAPFLEQVKQIRLKPPNIPFLSNTTGTWITQEEATNPTYWVKHLRSTVRFADCIKKLFNESNRVFLEVGPGAALSILANQHPSKQKSHVILSSTRHPKTQQSDSAFILETLGAIWRAGGQIDWMNFHAGARRLRIPLPTYPFERKRYWIESRNQRPAMTYGVADESQRIECLCPLNGYKKEEDTRGEKEKNIEEHVQSKDKRMSRSEVEQILMDIWRELLGHSEIKIDDNFFTLGGHSLVALRLFSRIDSIFGKRLPLATLLSAPTVSQLAALLVHDEYDPSWSSLVKIRAEGAKSPFFAIHSEGGNVLEYFKLASYLDKDRPFYGIQARGLEGKEIISLTIEEMARHYIAEIKSIQPEGPYFLGGFCLGGMIAFEIARQMEATGDHVAFLAMISTYSPDHLKRKFPNMSGARRYLYGIIERIELEKNNLSVLDLKEKLSYIRDRMRQLNLICRVIYEDFADLLIRNVSRKSYRHSRRYILEKTRKAQAQAFYEVKPSPVKTGITLFRVSRQPRSLIPDPTLGWAKLSEKGVFDFEIQAFHKNVLKEPNVKALAQQFQECLDEAQCLIDKDKPVLPVMNLIEKKDINL